MFILTDKVFDSKWCRVELCAAVRAGVNVVFVYKEGSQWTCPLTGVSARHPPDSFVEALELDADVAFQTRAMLMGYKSVEHSDVYYESFIAQLMQKLATPAKAAEMRTRAAAGAELMLPQALSGHTAPPHTSATQVSTALSTPAPTAHAAPAPRHTEPKLPVAKMEHAASGEQAHDDAQAFRQELVALRRELVALHVTAARETDARFYMLLGGAVAVVAITSCVAVVAVVAVSRRSK